VKDIKKSMVRVGIPRARENHSGKDSTRKRPIKPTNAIKVKTKAQVKTMKKDQSGKKTTTKRSRRTHKENQKVTLTTSHQKSKVHMKKQMHLSLKQRNSVQRWKKPGDSSRKATR
jgi:hypothetical protein